MEIGKRLRELRQARGLSQGDIEKRTGLLRCYSSTVENGHTVPSLETLEKYAKALDLELYQLFYLGKGKAEALQVAESPALSFEEKILLKAFVGLSKSHRRLLLDVARRIAVTERRKSVAKRKK